MKTIELFSGTESFSNVMRRHRHHTFTVDIDPTFHPDICADVQALSVQEFPYRPDILWASPPCAHFSVASIGRNWNRDYTPKSSGARRAIDLMHAMLGLICELHPSWVFIENPRGMLRKLPIMSGMIRRTVTYCQYGDTRQKPTDIWTNASWWRPRPACERGASCHEAAPRGARTGTQGIVGTKDRGRIPYGLFEEILSQVPLRSQRAA
jgi:hypothetical protein